MKSITYYAIPRKTVEWKNMNLLKGKNICGTYLNASEFII